MKKRTRKLVKLLWYNPANTVIYDSGNFSIVGKGFGEYEDADGIKYFIYGEQLGGGFYGEDADKRFIIVGRKYLLTAFWSEKGKLRASNVRLIKSGESPSTKLRDKMLEKTND